MSHRGVRICTLVFLAMLHTGTPAEEVFNRGLIAVVNDQNEVYLGWRLLKEDPDDVAFNVYRRTDGGSPVRVNAKPLVTSTNLIPHGSPERQNERMVRAPGDPRSGTRTIRNGVTRA